MVHKHTLNICLTAVFTALVFVITRFIQIPIPLGYFNVGNSIIMLACLFLPAPYAAFCGAAGAAIADLLSYPVWAIPTIIIKALMVVIFFILRKITRRLNPIVSTTVSSIVAMLIPFAGYTITGMILYGSIAAGLAQVPGLLLEYIANCVIFIIMYIVVFKRISEYFVHELNRP